MCRQFVVGNAGGELLRAQAPNNGHATALSLRGRRNTSYPVVMKAQICCRAPSPMGAIRVVNYSSPPGLSNPNLATC
jgi:hypothetical protein